MSPQIGVKVLYSICYLSRSRSISIKICPKKYWILLDYYYWCMHVFSFSDADVKGGANGHSSKVKVAPNCTWGQSSSQGARLLTGPLHDATQESWTQLQLDVPHVSVAAHDLETHTVISKDQVGVCVIEAWHQKHTHTPRSQARSTAKPHRRTTRLLSWTSSSCVQRSVTLRVAHRKAGRLRSFASSVSEFNRPAVVTSALPSSGATNNHLPSSSSSSRPLVSSSLNLTAEGEASYWLVTATHWTGAPLAPRDRWRTRGALTRRYFPLSSFPN